MNTFAGVCECGKDSRCEETHKLCNCGSDIANEWRRDRIEVKDNNKLPVVEMILGDLTGYRETAQIYVYNVVCRE